MKKVAIIAVCVLGCIFSGKAQDKGKIEFGLNTGLNLSNVTSGYNSTDSSISFNVGASADYYFSNRWSIKAILIYDRKGWDNDFVNVTNENGVPVYSYETNINVDYLTVPVLANWHFGSKRNWYLNFGGYAGFLIDAKDTELKQDLKDSFETTDFGLALGLGVKIPVSDKLKLFLEYQEQAGLTEVFSSNNNGSTIRNSRSSLNIGVNFLL